MPVVVLVGSLLAGCSGADKVKPAAGGITITSPALVTPESGAASLTARIDNQTGHEDEVVHVSARRGATKLSVYQGRGATHDVPRGKHTMGTSMYDNDVVVVRGVKPGQSIRVSFDFEHAKSLTVDVPAVANGPGYKDLDVYEHPPSITNGRFVVVPGQRCAFVGYTVDGRGTLQTSPLDKISVTDPNGKRIKWKHVTATGGSAEFMAVETPRDVDPVDLKPGEICDEDGKGDADYIDAAAVKVGETVQVSIEFAPGVVTAPFQIVAGQ